MSANTVGPVHERGMFNIEAFDGLRWRGGMNRATRDAAISAAKVWAADTGHRYRVFDPQGQLVFDTSGWGLIGVRAVLRATDDHLQRLQHYAHSRDLRNAMAALDELIEAAQEKQRVTGGGSVVTAAESLAVHKRLDAALANIGSMS